MLGCLRRPEPTPHERLQLLLVDGGAFGGDDDRDDLLPPLGVGDADDRRSRHGGMLDEHTFDLARRQVLAAPHDDVVEPAVHVQVPAGVEMTGVAGAEPAFVVAHASFQVLAGDLLAAHPDLAVGAGVDGRAGGVADRDLDGRQRHPD